MRLSVIDPAYRSSRFAINEPVRAAKRCLTGSQPRRAPFRRGAEGELAARREIRLIRLRAD